MTTSLRRFLSAVAVLAVVGGILLLALPVSAVTNAGGTASCGTAFAPDTGSGHLESVYAAYAARCDDAISTRRGWGYGIGVAGLLLAIGVGMASPSSTRPEDVRAEGDAPAA